MPGDPAPPSKSETLFEPRFLHPGIFLLMPLATLVAIGTLMIFRGIPAYLIVAVAVAIPLAVVGYWLHRFTKVRRVLRTYGRFLCLNCHYPLKGLPDEGLCPECRHPYQRTATERRWLSWEESVNKGKPIA